MSEFLARLFRIEAERKQQIASAENQSVVFDFKRNFLQRRVLKKFAIEEMPTWDVAQLSKAIEVLRCMAFPKIAGSDRGMLQALVA